MIIFDSIMSTCRRGGRVVTLSVGKIVSHTHTHTQKYDFEMVIDVGRCFYYSFTSEYYSYVVLLPICLLCDCECFVFCCSVVSLVIHVLCVRFNECGTLID